MTVRPDPFFRSRGIQCSNGLPDHVLEKAQTIIEQIESGAHFSKFSGHRLERNKSTISIPVGYSYRIIASETASAVQFRFLVSHEAYNKIIKGL